VSAGGLAASFWDFSLVTITRVGKSSQNRRGSTPPELAAMLIIDPPAKPVAIHI